jgi:DNA-binding transcriptional ArsR family regulator
MSQPAPIDAVMRTLADPTRRAVFERVVGASEITLGELTRGSGVTQGAISQHLESPKQAGLVVVLPRNETAFTGMGNGWKQVVRTIDVLSGEGASPPKHN